MELTVIEQLDIQVRELEEDFINYLPKESKLIFAQESLFAMQCFRRNDFLAKIAKQNPQSVRDAIFNLASVGLSLNPVDKQAYLIPRKGVVCLDPSYIGLADIATSQGNIEFVKAMLVYKDDNFVYKGVSQEPSHEFNPFKKDRGECIGVYCVAGLSNGKFLTEMMSIEECHGIRDRTDNWKKHKSGPWKTDEGEMVKKTVIKRASKLWPSCSARMRKAVDLSNMNDGIDFEAEKVEAKEEHEKQKGKVSAEVAEKRELLEEITTMCGLLTEGLSLNEKGEFMQKHLKVGSFKDLTSQKLDDLKLILNNLRDLEIAKEQGGGDE